MWQCLKVLRDGIICVCWFKLEALPFVQVLMPTWNAVHVYLALIYSLEWVKIKLFLDNTSSRCLSYGHPNLILWKSVLYIPDISHSSCNCSPFVFQCVKAVYFYLFWLFWGWLLAFFVSIKLFLFLLEKQLSIFKLDALAGWVIALYCVRLWKSCCWAEATEILA